MKVNEWRTKSGRSSSTDSDSGISSQKATGYDKFTKAGTSERSEWLGEARPREYPMRRVETDEFNVEGNQVIFY